MSVGTAALIMETVFVIIEAIESFLNYYFFPGLERDTGFRK